MVCELTSQQEDYLEAIAELSAASGSARAGEISARVSVHKSTVTAALHGLADKGLVNYRPYESISLTASGTAEAARILRRHRALSRFLTEVLCLPPDRAAENACRLEHAIDKGTTDRLIAFVEFLEHTPEVAQRVKDTFRERHGLNETEQTP